MKNPHAKIFVSAGESSSDMHGAELIKNILKISPHIEFYGLGGQKMAKAGVNLFYNIVDIAVVGLVEVLRNLPKFIKIFNNTVKKIEMINPDLAILIDNPAFNLRLAKKIKKLNIPTIYYISPQVWAWGRKRIFKMKNLINKMLVFFKFEEDLYKQYGINCKFVGHPLIEIVKPKRDKQSFKEKINVKSSYPIIGLFPGSREKEIRNHLPVLIKTAEKIRKKYAQSCFIIAKPANIKKAVYQKFISPDVAYIKLVNDNIYDCINISDFCIVASGTAALETAILETPMVIIYKTSLFTYLMLKPQIKVPHIGMVNIIAGKKIVPEIIQNDFKPQIIADKVCFFMDKPYRLGDLKGKLKKVKKLLGEDNASRKAAEEIVRLVQCSKFKV